MPSHLNHTMRGMALIAVLWMIAALAILVASTIYAVRIDTRIAFAHLDAARARTLTESAITLAAAELATRADLSIKQTEFQYQIEDQTIVVTVNNDSGYINLNNANKDLLSDLFQYGAQLPAEQAQILAENIIRWREITPDAADQTSPASTKNRFYDPADLQKISGINEQVYATLLPLLTTEEDGADMVNAFCSSPAVLRVLTRGDTNKLQQALAIIRAETTEQTNLRINLLGIAHHTEWFSTTFHFQAVIQPQAEQTSTWTRKALLRVTSNDNAKTTTLPWHWQTLYPVIKKPA